MYYQIYQTFIERGREMSWKPKLNPVQFRQLDGRHEWLTMNQLMKEMRAWFYRFKHLMVRIKLRRTKEPTSAGIKVASIILYLQLSFDFKKSPIDTNKNETISVFLL